MTPASCRVWALVLAVSAASFARLVCEEAGGDQVQITERSMRPIEFSLTALLPLSPEEIASRIADVEQWSEFDGYGIVPGIRSARYERRTDAMEGSRVRVENRDGSRHVEEIVHWELPHRIVMRLAEFSPPLRWLAEQFQEEWRFEGRAEGTWVRRTFTLHPRGGASWGVLWIISHFLRRAILRHLRELGSGRGGHLPV